MTDRAHPESGARRTFLKAAVAASGATALASRPAMSAPEAAPSTDIQPEPPPEQRGYRETEHVRRYYETLRE